MSEQQGTSSCLTDDLAVYLRQLRQRPCLARQTNHAVANHPESKPGHPALIPTRFISTTVDEVYQAMRNNPGLPNKDEAASLPEFVQELNTKLQARLSMQLSQTKKRGSKGLQ